VKNRLFCRLAVLALLSGTIAVGFGGSAATAAITNGPIGATVNPGPYTSCKGSFACAAKTFDGYVSGSAGSGHQALTAQKWYYQAGQLPTTLSPQITALHKQGTLLYISFRPSQKFSSKEDAKFSDSLKAHIKALTSNGFRVILWQEPNASNYFPSASSYKTYVSHYAPMVTKLGLKIVYDPALCAPHVACNESSAEAFYPGDKYTTGGILLDYYCTSYQKGTVITGKMQALADNHKPSPLTLGLGEWGDSGDGQACSAWKAYANYLVTFFTARNKAGHVNGAIMYWNGRKAAGFDPVKGPHDFKVPAIQRIADLGL
jgi:ferredoxin